MFDRTHILIFLSALGIALGAGFGIQSLRQPPINRFFEQFYRDGFDFLLYQGTDEDFVKYKIGDQLDTSRFISGSSRVPYENAISNPMLLVVVDPTCPFVKTSS